jgi:hypothetical protein
MKPSPYRGRLSFDGGADSISARFREHMECSPTKNEKFSAGNARFLCGFIVFLRSNEDKFEFFYCLLW